VLWTILRETLLMSIVGIALGLAVTLATHAGGVGVPVRVDSA
jgi:hypothetical protein